jgi:O-antigen/teichoic acid export membrane protein
MNKRSIIIIIEYLWIAMAVFCVIMGIYYSNKAASGNVWIIYLMAVISLGMFFVRRMQRKNQEKRNKKYGNN